VESEYRGEVGKEEFVPQLWKVAKGGRREFTVYPQLWKVAKGEVESLCQQLWKVAQGRRRELVPTIVESG
jgi:hypothetical protein